MGKWNTKYKNLDGEKNKRNIPFSKVWKIMYKYGILVHADKKKYLYGIILILVHLIMQKNRYDWPTGNIRWDEINLITEYKYSGE